VRGDERGGCETAGTGGKAGAGELSVRGEERVRLFVALELPDEVREALVRWRAGALAGGPGVRPITGEDLHATLCFLGWRDAADVEAIRAACARVATHPAPELALGQAIWLPPRRPRVLAVELGDATGALASAQAELSGILAAGGWYEPEKRSYLAHVTVARLGRGAKLASRELPRPPTLRFRASTITLYRSRLLRAGARYEALARIELTG
jgi:2'-5' RNA ligase